MPNLISNKSYSIQCWSADGTPSNIAEATVNVGPPPIPGRCGDNNKNFEYNEDWNDKECCEVGSIVGGASCESKNPTAGAETSTWHCSGVNGGDDSPECSATREEEDTNSAKNWIER